MPDGYQDGLTKRERSGLAMKRRIEALDLRIAGATYQQIADRFNITKQSAHGLVQKALTDRAGETTEAVRELELSRLDKLLMSWLPRAISGDEKAAGVVLSIMDRRSKYLGLDAPRKVNLTIEEAREDARAAAQRAGLAEDEIEQAVQMAEAIVRGRA